MSQQRRTRKLRRVNNLRLRSGWDAGTRHKSKSGRTGKVQSTKRGSRRRKVTPGGTE